RLLLQTIESAGTRKSANLECDLAQRTTSVSDPTSMRIFVGHSKVSSNLNLAQTLPGHGIVGHEWIAKERNIDAHQPHYWPLAVPRQKRCSLRFAVASSVSTKLPAGMIFRRRRLIPLSQVGQYVV